MRLKCKAYEFDTLYDYKYVNIFARYNSKWIFCKEKNRTTWENPGGHIEEGEAPIEAAKRELIEETGAVSFDIEPLCDYWASGELNGIEIPAHGQVYYSNIHILGEIPEQSEMQEIYLLDSLPNELTYPDFMNEIFPIALKKL